VVVVVSIVAVVLVDASGAVVVPAAVSVV